MNRIRWYIVMALIGIACFFLWPKYGPVDWDVVEMWEAAE